MGTGSGNALVLAKGEEIVGESCRREGGVAITDIFLNAISLVPHPSFELMLGGQRFVGVHRDLEVDANRTSSCIIPNGPSMVHFGLTTLTETCFKATGGTGMEVINKDTLTREELVGSSCAIRRRGLRSRRSWGTLRCTALFPIAARGARDRRRGCSALVNLPLLIGPRERTRLQKRTDSREVDVAEAKVPAKKLFLRLCKVLIFDIGRA
jgi:hypothetical protein